MVNIFFSTCIQILFFKKFNEIKYSKATAHVGMYLNDNDFNAVVDNAAKTLTDLGVS